MSGNYKVTIMDTHKKLPMIHYFDDLDLDYKIITNLVGGYFTCLPLKDSRLMFLNENGMNTCKFNKEASDMFQFDIYGDAVILGVLKN